VVLLWWLYLEEEWPVLVRMHGCCYSRSDILATGLWYGGLCGPLQTRSPTCWRAGCFCCATAAPLLDRWILIVGSSRYQGELSGLTCVVVRSA